MEDIVDEAYFLCAIQTQFLNLEYSTVVPTTLVRHSFESNYVNLSVDFATRIQEAYFESFEAIIFSYRDSFKEILPTSLF